MTVLDRILGQPYYFHRQISDVGNYRVANASAPTLNDNNTIKRTLNPGVYEVGTGWIFTSAPKDYLLTKDFNFLFSVYARASSNAEGKLFFKFYVWRNGQETALFTADSSETLAVGPTLECHLWQHRLGKQTVQVRQGDRLVMRLFIDVAAAGTFEAGYDCLAYPSSVNDPVETRYLRPIQGTTNGLNCFVLGTIQGVTAKQSIVPDGQLFGIRVWKRAAGGTETEITAGTPVAQVTIPLATQMLSATWTPTQTSLVSTDSIVVRVYWNLSGVWYLAVTDEIPEKNCEYQTEQLTASQLDAVEWTVYYQFRLYNEVEYFRFGHSASNSRIENFSWSTAATPIPVFMHHYSQMNKIRRG